MIEVVSSLRIDTLQVPDRTASRHALRRAENDDFDIQTFEHPSARYRESSALRLAQSLFGGRQRRDFAADDGRTPRIGFDDVPVPAQQLTHPQLAQALRIGHLERAIQRLVDVERRFDGQLRQRHLRQELCIRGVRQPSRNDRGGDRYPAHSNERRFAAHTTHYTHGTREFFPAGGRFRDAVPPVGDNLGRGRKKTPSPVVLPVTRWQMPVSVDQVREQLVSALPRLRRFARTLTRDIADADDLVQIAVERALLRFDQWRPESRFESWMFGIIRNAWIDEVRSRRRQERVFLPEENGENVGDASNEAQATRLSMQRALMALPEEQREAIALVLIEGLSYKEASDVLGIPMGTLTSRLARGREAMQANLS